MVHAVRKLDVLSYLGENADYLSHPPKEHLVEKVSFTFIVLSACSYAVLVTNFQHFFFLASIFILYSCFAVFRSKQHVICRKNEAGA